MSHSNAFRPWPVEVDDDVAVVRQAVWDSFRCGTDYVRKMWCEVATAQGALNYHKSGIDLEPVIEFLQFVQEKLFDQGLEVAGAAQQGVYDAWYEREPIVRQQRRSLGGLALATHDPELAHVP